MLRPILLLVLVASVAACGSDSVPFYLYDTGPTTTVGGADAGADLGPVGCEGSEDCGDNEECVESVCTPTCVTDDDCGGATPLCNVDAGVCVECLAESNCGPNQTCAEWVCVTICDGPEDCGGGECVEGACVPIDPICTPAETLCEGNSVATCNADGTGFETGPCDDGECVVANGSASCVSSECVPSERGCFDDETAFECAEDGSARVPEPCGVDRECLDGECVDVAPPCIELSTTEIAFGAVRVGELAARTVSISPCAESTAVVGLGAITGTEWFSLFGREAPFRLDSAEEFTVEFAPDGPGEFFGEVAFDLEGTSEMVELRGVGVPRETECPVSEVRCRIGDPGEFAEFIEIPFGIRVECTGRFTDAEVAEFRWRLASAPEGSEVELPVTSAESILFEPDRDGLYEIELDITDTDGVAACDVAVAEVFVFDGPPDRLPSVRTTISWDNEADLDNHMLLDGGSWNEAPEDCYWNNMAPEWGAVLDSDDTDGFGPESISLSPSGPITVRVGARVQRLSDAGPTTATMALFVDDELRDELDVRFSAGDQFWEVWEVTITEDGVELVELDSLTSGAP